ncbi:MAG: LLM class flavin-dependent oxidoreductase, partial [Nitrospinaceae bacterium]|nr:LLM class flavin-dependent oxidoreductase [Nitrospinaceae bacterium]
MVDKEVKIGIAMRNFTAFPELPDAQALIEYGVKMETLGFESLWVWDHILLGVEPHFPIIESLSLLTAVAARTDKIKLGTGVLVLPLRNPLVLAKQLSSIDQISQGRLIVGMASGWYKREFDAVGVPFEKRGNIMDQNIEIMNRLWTEDMVRAEYGQYNLRNSVM